MARARQPSVKVSVERAGADHKNPISSGISAKRSIKSERLNARG
jgi:hypothetical protein